MADDLPRVKEQCRVPGNHVVFHNTDATKNQFKFLFSPRSSNVPEVFARTNRQDPV